MMRLFTFILFIAVFVPATAQKDHPKSYAEAIQMGNKALKGSNYIQALNMYFAAEAFDLTKKDSVKEKINGLFILIDKLKKKAEDDKNRAEKAEKKALEAQKQTSIALKQANKLLDAFHFYEDRFAIAYKNNSYYFIDQEADEVDKLGKWDGAEQFDIFDLARVRKGNTNYLLDTFGNPYRVAYNLNDLKSDTKALYLSKEEDLLNIDLANPSLEILILELDEKMVNPTFKKLIQFKKLKALNIVYADIYKWPDGLEQLEYLKELRFFLSGVKDLSKIFELKKLEILELPYATLPQLPDEIGELHNLKVLDLSTSQLTNIPGTIGNLKKLCRLNLSESPLLNLPKEIGKLESMIDLNIATTTLRDLPKELGQLGNLEILNLSNDTLDNFPKQIFNLKKLKTLYMSGNSLKSIPGEIGNLHNLVTLDLSYNELKKIPKEIGKLTHLTTLSLRYNHLKKLPREIEALKNLRKVDLSGNDIPEAVIEKLKILLPNCEIRNDYSFFDF